jgi:hypothetical protein
LTLGRGSHLYLPQRYNASTGEPFPAERLQLLQHARQMARKHAEQQGLKYKENLDKHTVPHEFTVDQKVWLSDTAAQGKNPKLTLKLLGPYKIVDLNDNNTKIEIKPNKFKIIDISRLKTFKEEKPTHLSQDNSHLSQGNPDLFQNSNNNFPQRPMNRSLKKLIDYKNTADMAISLLNDELEEECDGNIFAEGNDKYHCKNCYNVIKKFSHFALKNKRFHGSAKFN